MIIIKFLVTAYTITEFIYFLFFIIDTSAFEFTNNVIFLSLKIHFPQRENG